MFVAAIVLHFAMRCGQERGEKNDERQENEEEEEEAEGEAVAKEQQKGEGGREQRIWEGIYGGRCELLIPVLSNALAMDSSIIVLTLSNAAPLTLGFGSVIAQIWWPDCSPGSNTSAF